ncbi:MAG: hypothetical protein L0H53_08750 [Candidatus Nitrosocosmicus sp.]|nr:hypothetical protein [Candidatus Nitrosocosmicus sp.]
MVGIITLFSTDSKVFAQTTDRLQDIEWNTFENSEYGFSVDYPEMMGEPNTYLDVDWSSDIPSVRNLPQMVNFFNPDNEENPLFTYIDAELRIYANHEDKSLPSFILEDFMPSKMEVSLGPPEIKIVDGKMELTFETTSTTILNENRYFAFTHNNDLIYIFGVEHVDYENGDYLYNDMLDSLDIKT